MVDLLLLATVGLGLGRSSQLLATVLTLLAQLTGRLLDLGGEAVLGLDTNTRTRTATTTG